MAGNKFKYDPNVQNINYFWGSLMNERLKHTVDYTKSQCYGVLDVNQNPVIAWSYHSFLQEKHHNQIYLEGAVSICAFQKQWRPFKIIPKIFALYFQNKCYNRLTAVTHQSNIQANRLLKLAGFTLEGKIRKQEPLEDLNQYSILRKEWEISRWVELQTQ